MVEREVVRQLIDAIDAYFVTVDAAENRQSTGGQSILAKSITDAETELQKVEKQILAAYDLLEQGVYSTDVFTQRQKALSAKKEELTESIADMAPRRGRRSGGPGTGQPHPGNPTGSRRLLALG